MAISRRSFFTRTGAIAAGAASSPFVSIGAEAGFSPGQRPRHIIHLVSDGMSAGTLSCADALSQLRRKRSLAWIGLLTDPRAHTGLMNMRSLNSLVTDSSAAASSWGSGSRIENGAVNVLPDGRELTPLYTLFKQKGWKRGLVTTTEITHATPSGFAANDKSRGSAENIARQYYEREVDVLLGGGLKFFRADKREDKRDLIGDFERAGYAVMRTRDELKAAPNGKRWLGVFADGHLPFTVDHREDEKAKKNVPTLAELTEAALLKLSYEPNFILQVEGGRVDHGCHNCDAAGALNDQIAFDEALEACLDFQKREPGTLLVITTDHGNGNPGLNGMGDNYGKSSELFANLNRIRASFSTITGKLKETSTPEEVQTLLGDLTGYKVPAREAVYFTEFLSKKGHTLFGAMNSTTTQLGQLLGNYTGIGWAGGAHTGDYVMITAIGPGAERFHGFVQNTDVFYHYLSLAGIDFRNPTMPLRAGVTRDEEHPDEYVLV